MEKLGGAGREGVGQRPSGVAVGGASPFSPTSDNRLDEVCRYLGSSGPYTSGYL